MGTGGESFHPNSRIMTRTLSTRSVLKTLREAGFPMDAIIEQSRGRIEIGYLIDGRAEWNQQQKNWELANQASELLGWDWFGSGYGSAHLWANRGCSAHRELVSSNID